MMGQGDARCFWFLSGVSTVFKRKSSQWDEGPLSSGDLD